jgi:hypothetical protein
MRASSLLRILFRGTAYVAVTCAPITAFAQHGGFHGGSGFHGGGGFHGGTVGGFHGGNFHSGGMAGPSAPGRFAGSGGWSRGVGGFRALGNSSLDGRHWAGSGDIVGGRARGASAGHGFVSHADGLWHSFEGSGERNASSPTTRKFASTTGRSSGTPSAWAALRSSNADSQWHSFGSGSHASVAKAAGTSGPRSAGMMAANTHAPTLSADSNHWSATASGVKGSGNLPRAMGGAMSTSHAQLNIQTQHFGNTPLSNFGLDSTAFGNSRFTSSRFGAFGHPSFGVRFGHAGFSFPSRAFVPHPLFIGQDFFFHTPAFFGPHFFFGSPFFFFGPRFVFFGSPFFLPSPFSPFGPTVFVSFGSGFFTRPVFAPVAFDPFPLGSFCRFCAPGGPRFFGSTQMVGR